MSGVRTVEIAADEADVRLDRWFKRRFPELSHGRLEKLLRTGQVRIDGKRAKAGLRVAAGQQVRIPPFTDHSVDGPRRRPPPAGADAAETARLRAAVLYRDDWAIAIDKPAGLAVQGGTGQTRHLDAMLDALRVGTGDRPRLVHRLDKDTSGVLMLAPTVAAARRLAGSFKDKSARKLYWALVAGQPPRPRGRIDVALAKLPGAGGEKVGAADDDGKAAVTVYHTVTTRRGITWLLLMPLTGRTHQLRAHCAGIGLPILGDGKYGGKAAFPAAADGLSKRLMLHAREIALPHPEDGTTLRVSAPLPADMAAAWRHLGFEPEHGETAVNALLAYAEALPDSHADTAPHKGKRRR